MIVYVTSKMLFLPQIRGMPYEATATEVCRFFKDCDIAGGPDGGNISDHYSDPHICSDTDPKLYPDPDSQESTSA